MKRPLEEEFSKHVATIEQEGDVTKIRWQQPGTWCFAVKYIITDNVLMVYGDLGEAVYVWGSPISLQFLSTLGIDYFASKCMASEEGQGYREWCYETAEKYLQDEIDERIRDFDINFEDEPKPENITFKDLIEYNGGDSMTLQYKEEWNRFMADLDDYCLEFPSGAKLSMEDRWDIGMVISSRCKLHLIGIQMAYKQLQDRAEKNADQD
jgi:hypothetical protein